MHELLNILQQILIPQAKCASLSMVVAPNILRRHELSAAVVEGVTVHAHPSSLLPDSRRRVPWPHSAIWKRYNLEAALLPRIGYVLDGEFEVYLGVTNSMAREDPELTTEHGIYTVTLPETTWLVVLAGVPLGGGRNPYFALVPPELARSRIFWISFLPMGVICNYHHREGLSDVSHVEIFIPDHQCSMIADFFLEAVREDTDQAKALMQAHLRALLLRINGIWSRSSTIDAGKGFLSHLPTLSASDSTALSLRAPAHNQTFQPSPVEAARGYISSHLGQALSVKILAANSCIAPGRLNRLFVAEVGMSVKQYITQSRIEAACSMLEHTNLPVEWIGSHFAFASHTYFYRVFTKQTGMSPRAFRKTKRPGRAPHIRKNR